MKNGGLYYFLSGYLTVCADGQFTERLINICMHRGMNIFDVKKCGSNRVVFKMDVRSYLQIRTPARRTQSHVRIIKRHGLPFILRRYRHRKTVIAGLAVFVLILWYTSNHVMGITVFGNNRVDTQTITEALNECGLSLGIRTSEVDPDIIRNRMMNKLSDLAWVGVNANGSRVYIEIVERIETDEGVDKSAPACDLVAEKDGEIEKIEVREGQTVVNVGSGVRKGDVLVSGIVDSPVKGFDYVRARGEVIAKTRYVRSKSYPLEFTEQIPVGNVKKYYSVKIMDKEIPLYINQNPPYESFEHSENTREYRLPIDIVPSLFVRCDEYREVIPENKKRTASEAVELGKKELTEELKAEIGEDVEIIEENVTYTLSEFNTADVTVELLCRENIAKEYVIEVSLDDAE